MTLRPEQIGDRGQRYEVRYRDDRTLPDQMRPIGWTNDLEDARSMAAGWLLRKTPGLVVRVVDRQAAAEPEPAAAPFPPA